MTALAGPLISDINLAFAHLVAYEDSTGKTRLEISPRGAGGVSILGIVIESNGIASRIGIAADVTPGALVNIGGDVQCDHLIGGTAVPSVTAGAGAGANATVSVTGDDISGTISLTTSVLDTPTANAGLVQLTFNTPYKAAPIVLLMPANSAAAALAIGSWLLIQANVTTIAFAIRSGAIALPALTAATYTWNYHVIQ